MKTVEQCQQELEALLAEKKQIEESIQLNKKQLLELNERLYKLNGGLHGYGLIKQAELDLRDAAFPVYEYGDFGTTRVIAVTDKMITLRQDRGLERVYRISDGFMARTRNNQYGTPIDVAKALKIWSEHVAAKEKGKQ